MQLATSHNINISIEHGEVVVSLLGYNDCAYGYFSGNAARSSTIRRTIVEAFANINDDFDPKRESAILAIMSSAIYNR